MSGLLFNYYKLVIRPRATEKLSLRTFKSAIFLPKNGSDKSSIGRPYHEAGDEETAGDASSVRPTGDKEVHEKDDPEGGQGEGTCRKRHIT